MNAWREVVEVQDIGSDSLQVVLPPRDLGGRPHRVITVAVAEGEDQCGLTDADIETGPSADGPWFAEDIAASGIPTLGEDGNGVYQFTGYGRFLRILAQAAVEVDKTCDLTIYLDAEA